MNDPAATDPSPDISHAILHVERGVGDLRRGLPVIIQENGRAVLAAAAELVTDRGLKAFRHLAAAALALTAKRAAVLHIPPMASDGVLLKLTADMDAGMVHALADPAEDLNHPLMGPFRPAEIVMGDLTAAAIQLAKHARLLPAAVIGAIPAGAAADFAVCHDLLAVEASEIRDFGANSACALTQIVVARVPLHDAENARVIAFRPESGSAEHLAIIIGDPSRHEPVLARIHSECFTGDLLGSMKCDCGEQLRGAIQEIAKAGGGVLLYLAQEGRGIGLINKLRAYRLQDQGFDTVEANERLGFEADERLFLAAAEMLKKLGFSAVRLMTNNPDKVQGLEACGIRVAERVAHKFPSNSHNEFYLATKKKRSGHYL